MATITGSSSASMIARAPCVRNANVGVTSSSLILGSPKKARVGKVRCSMEEKSCTFIGKDEAEPSMSMGASLVAAATAAAMSSPAALALVDERMSTEGTGLPFGLSNNLLGWILLAVFGLIWSLYTVYTSTLDDDEDSGLSL